MVNTKDEEIRLVAEMDYEVIKAFLSKAGASLKSFRYFKRRDFSVLKNHVITAIIFINQEPIGYGHLDQDEDRIWLGIAIVEGFKGQGYGVKMMDFLFAKAKEKNLTTISLCVDVDNTIAIKLYKKMGFEIVKHISKGIYLMECNLIA